MPLAKRVECSPMVRETRVQIQVESYQRLKKKIKIKLDDYRNNSEKKNLRGHFLEPIDGLTEFDLYIHIKCTYCAKILFFFLI